MRTENANPKIRPNYLDRTILWWSVDEAAAYAYVTRRTIHDWSYKGWIVTRRVPKKWPVSRVSLEKLLAGSPAGDRA